MSSFSAAAFLAELKKKTTKTISVKVIPGARKNEITGLMPDGGLKIKLTAPPVDGRANQALLEFLAAEFKLKKNQVGLVRGWTSRNKVVEFRLAQN